MTRKNRMSGFAAALVAALLSGTAAMAADGDLWKAETSRDADNNIVITFEEVEVTLPESWSGKCLLSTVDTGASFYQIKSRDLWTEKLGFKNGGYLFSISCRDDYNFDDLPAYQILGTGDGGIYYLEFPTDLQAYTEDAEAYGEFMQMSADVEWIVDNIRLIGPNTSYLVEDADDDYILPQSSTAYLSESDLAGMDSDMIQMAINEIYARHGRKFVMESVQDYFNAKSWYVGTVEAEDFDIKVMNQYESANIDLMVKMMEKQKK